MTSKATNERLTRVAADTPMGRLMRRYWHPICTSEQVARADSDPIRSRLLGEDFVIFRDTAGRVGVLDEYCMHRRVSLALGRVEKGGIRCLYHGWKFAADGEILDTPNHCDSRLREKVRAPAHPAVEAGGLVWTYIGDPARRPPLPAWSLFDAPHTLALRLNTRANYLQLYEGGTDSSHVGILHSNVANPSWMDDAFAPPDDDLNPGAISVPDNSPQLSLENTDYGYRYAAIRKGAPGADGTPMQSVRVTPVMLPTGRIIPAPAYQFFLWETPRDDHSTSTYIAIAGDKPIDRDRILAIMGLDDTRFWNPRTCDFTADWAHGMNQDRDAMRTRNWTGLSGIEQEDAVLAVSMGPIVDRSKEFLVAADRAVVQLRTRLLDALAAIDRGEDPEGLWVENRRAVIAVADTAIPADARWQDCIDPPAAPRNFEYV